MKKIVILTHYFTPEMGAPQSRLSETAKGLQKLGWEVVVITTMPNYPTGKIFKEYRNRFFISDQTDGIQTWRYWVYASNSRKAIPRIISMISFSLTSLFSLFKIRRFKPDYIFTESPPLTLGLSGLMLSKLSNSKHILNVSDLWPLSAFELGAISKGSLYNFLEKLEYFLYKRSFACTGQSKEIINHIIKIGIDKVLLFRNGVDFDRFDKLETQPEVSKARKTRIVYAGLLGVAQGILALCENVDFSLLNCEFHIYGEGVERKKLHQYISDYPDKGIYLHEAVKRDKVPQMLKGYDITIIPLIKPIFGAVPSKIYEAMAAGLPIIFAGGGEGATIVKEYKVGWVCDPSDFIALRSVIESLGSMEKSELLEFKANSINTAKNVFNRKIQIESLNNFLVTNQEETN